MAFREPQITVLVTTHRTPQMLLLESLESILHQTFSEIELVLIVDDDVPSKSLSDEVRQRILSDRRGRIVERGRMGRGAALNEGLRNARASFVAIQDADDLSHPRRLEFQHRAMIANPGIFGLGTKAVKLFLPKPEFPAIDEAFCLRAVGRDLLLQNQLVHTTMLMRLPELIKLGGYAQNRKYQFDYELYLRARAAGMPLAQLDAPLAFKRFHEAQYFERGVGLDRLRSSLELQRRFINSEQTLLRPFLLAAVSCRFWIRAAKLCLNRRAN